jgi:amidophosphoribosyltransferase
MGDADTIGHACGLAGAYNVPNAAQMVWMLLYVQQHRGEAGVGFVTSEGQTFQAVRELGRVDRNFPLGTDFSKWPGDKAIGHVRYATHGSAHVKHNVQPIIVRVSNHGEMALAHNGTLINAEEERQKMLKKGHCFQSTTDSELLLQRMAGSKASTLEDAVLEGISAFPASYSLLIFTPDKLVALRDKYGVRPLSIATMGKGYLAASETSAFHILKKQKANFLREVEPGEMVVFDKKGMHSTHYAKPQEHTCVFEFAYFSDPHSCYKGFEHTDFRWRCGVRVYEENKAFFDGFKGKPDVRVIPILDSGKQGAWGFTEASGLSYREYFLRRHNAPRAGRSYTAPTQLERQLVANAKLDLREDKVKGRTVITVDDSNVRGTTARNNNDRLREAGAAKIINVYLMPPIVDVCCLGMDHQKTSELVATGRTNEQIAKNVHADHVFYLSPAGLNKIVNETYKSGICSGCFGGRYPPCCKSSTAVDSSSLCAPFGKSGDF